MAIYSLRLSPIGKTTQKQPFTAAANVRYITRKGAATLVMGERMPCARVPAMRWLRQQEKADRVNARVADKLVIALPIELSLDEQRNLVWLFAEQLTQKRASWFAAIHASGKDRKNPHVHLLVRDRDVTTGRRVVMFSAGTKEVQQRKARGAPAPTTLRDIRRMWEVQANAALAAVGVRDRIDHRSFVDQGIRRLPQIHEGPNVRAMDARGVRPVSRDRKVRNGPGNKTSHRTVPYAEIDQGQSRVEYNQSLARKGPMSLTQLRARQLGVSPTQSSTDRNLGRSRTR